MQIYQDLNDAQKITARRWGLFLLGLANVFLVVLVASYAVSLWLDVKNAGDGAKELRVSVSGEGKVAAEKTDVVAKIAVSVLTEKPSLNDAQAENSKKTNSVVEYLKKQSIEARDIKTVGYNIYPQYSYPQPCPRGLPGVAVNYPCPLEDRQPKIIGYQVRASYAVTIREISKAGDIIGGVVSAGANEVGGISFTIDQPDELKAKARTKAIEDAKTKAEKLAKDLGKRVGKILDFSESGIIPPIYFREAMALDKGGGAPAPSPAIEPGENEITVNVAITYEFK